MWDERYADEEYVYGTDPNEFLKEQVSKLPKGKVAKSYEMHAVKCNANVFC